MATRSTIMDGNSFRSGDGAALDAETTKLIERREENLGAAYRLFYRRPVQLVEGSGAYVTDETGRRYLDLYNNVASVGHAHPRVAEAVYRQMSTLNTHTRYLHDAIVNYSDDLLRTLPDEIDQIMFMCTGSEANDLAIRVARAFTGGEGIVVSSEAYHGNTLLTSAHSPALGGNQTLDPTSRVIAAPDPYRVHEAETGEWFANEMQRTIDLMTGDGIPFAGFLADSIFSSDGVFANSPGYLDKAIDVVHKNGGVFIADEVQPGFGRTGDSFWGFGRHHVAPDIVTMGKPMGNGIPISGMAARREVLEAFSLKFPYFNTFGGNPVSIAAGQTVLDIIRDEELQSRARSVGEVFRQQLRVLQARYTIIGDVRGAGQFTGLELVSDRETKEPSPLSLDVVEALRDRGVLTSVAGQLGNVLKLRPPLAFQEADIAWAVQALDESFSSLEM